MLRLHLAILRRKVYDERKNTNDGGMTYGDFLQKAMEITDR